MTIESLAGFGLLVTCVLLLVFFAFVQKRSSPRALRPIPAFQGLMKAVNLAVEDGKRLHVALGSAGLLTENSSASFVGLSTLERMAIISMFSDRPPVATSGDGALAILSQDTLHYVARSNNLLSQYDSIQGRLTGVTPFSFAVGAIPVVRSEQVYTNVFIGQFGPEIAFLNDAADLENSFCLAATSSLAGQAVLYATAQEPLIGEELYAAPAYLKGGLFHQASLQVQDILRWALIIFLTGGAIIKIIQLVLGYRFI